MPLASIWVETMFSLNRLKDFDLEDASTPWQPLINNRVINTHPDTWHPLLLLGFTGILDFLPRFPLL
ncbi:MAG TPA: hypothetical protein EYG38_21505 [Verrucomicrobia bacterium]|nr:hypothetical protein [Verrucomicrobiota bacterium]